MLCLWCMPVFFYVGVQIHFCCDRGQHKQPRHCPMLPLVSNPKGASTVPKTAIEVFVDHLSPITLADLISRLQGFCCDHLP